MVAEMMSADWGRDQVIVAAEAGADIVLLIGPASTASVVDGFAITTNIDLGVAGPHPLDLARTLRTWTRLPVAVSGGFGTADQAITTDPSWDILIVGRSVADAVDPALAATQLINHIITCQPAGSLASLCRAQAALSFGANSATTGEV